MCIGQPCSTDAAANANGQEPLSTLASQAPSRVKTHNFPKHVQGHSIIQMFICQPIVQCFLAMQDVSTHSEVAALHAGKVECHACTCHSCTEVARPTCFIWHERHFAEVRRSEVICHIHEVCFQLGFCMSVAPVGAFMLSS